MHYHEGTEHLVTVFGMLFVAALIVFWLLARRNATRIGIDPSHIDLLLPLSIIGGIIGGTLLSMLMPEDRQVAGEMLQVDTRIRLFGLVISGAVVVFIYSRVAKQSFRTLLDVLAMPTLAALIVHRCGCFLAGCCWGDISVTDPWLSSIATTDLGRQVQTLPWLAGEWVKTGVTYGPGTFPFQQQVAIGLIDVHATRSLPVHPVQLYEAALLGVFLLLFGRLRLDRYPAGSIALLTMAAYALIRFVMEYLRADGNIAFGILTATQLQCIALLVLATGLGMISRHATHHQRIRPE
jgi:phosphatidylglycerol:prolipoprotein diacylglycerol transferase